MRLNESRRPELRHDATRDADLFPVSCMKALLPSKGTAEPRVTNVKAVCRNSTSWSTAERRSRRGLHSNNLLRERTSIFLLSSESGLEERMKDSIPFAFRIETSMNQLQGNEFLLNSKCSVQGFCIEQNSTYVQ
jgi:hypothetical protein